MYFIRFIEWMCVITAVLFGIIAILTEVYIGFIGTVTFVFMAICSYLIEKGIIE